MMALDLVCYMCLQDGVLSGDGKLDTMSGEDKLRDYVR